MRNSLLLTLAALLVSAPGCPAGPASDAQIVPIDAERYRVDLMEDDQAVGADQPLVTFVLFSDYACRPCGRAWGVAEHLVEHFPDDLRVVHRSYSVAGYQNGELAAEAAYAAGAQGKFWEMHRALFADQDGFSRASLRAHATTIGLDVPRFFDDLDSGAYSALRARHRRQAEIFGIRALPIGFVNGLPLLGSPLLDEAGMRRLIEAEVARSRRLLQDGVPRDRVYATYMDGAVVKSVMESDEAKALREKRGAAGEAAKAPLATFVKPNPAKRYALPEGGRPAFGPVDAPVVVIEFIDFECPFCRQAATDVIPELAKRYPEDVRIEFRMLPVEMHPGARVAAKGALAADRQGKFGAFADAVWGERTHGLETLKKMAADAGLDVEKFDGDFADATLEAAIDDDVALANRLGVMGTPGFFVNGRFIDGLHDLGVYTAAIDEELARAAELTAAGTARANLHRELVADALPEEQFPNAGGPQP
jgi:protein-disulfide isomerase